MKNVLVYTTPSCQYCKMAKEFFQEKGVTYTEFDVSVDEDKRSEMVDKSGQMGVPVILVEDEVIVGFDEPKLRELLSIEG